MDIGDIRKRISKALVRDKYLYVLILPGLLFFVVFCYLPMGGIFIAFKNYSVFKGIWESPWVGLKHFEELFQSMFFWRVLRNTLIISAYKLLICFPFPILLALLLNEIKLSWLKRSIQTVLYLPHFLSWIVVGGIVMSLLSIEFGVVKEIFRFFGREPFNLLGSARHFRGILVITQMWKESGWETIIFLAAISQTDQNLIEASIVDGAGRWTRMWHITLPSISGVIVLLLVLSIGSLMDAGFEQIFALQNYLVLEVSDIFDTYILRVGLGGGKYSFTTAVGLFKSVVSTILILAANKLSKHISGEGLM